MDMKSISIGKKIKNELEIKRPQKVGEKTFEVQFIFTKQKITSNESFRTLQLSKYYTYADYLSIVLNEARLYTRSCEAFQ